MGLYDFLQTIWGGGVYIRGGYILGGCTRDFTVIWIDDFSPRLSLSDFGVQDFGILPEVPVIDDGAFPGAIE